MGTVPISWQMGTELDVDAPKRASYNFRNHMFLKRTRCP
jgi:hypothetical protein